MLKPNADRCLFSPDTSECEHQHTQPSLSQSFGKMHTHKAMLTELSGIKLCCLPICMNLSNRQYTCLSLSETKNICSYCLVETFINIKALKKNLQFATAYTKPTAKGQSKRQTDSSLRKKWDWKKRSTDACVAVLNHHICHRVLSVEAVTFEVVE